MVNVFTSALDKGSVKSSSETSSTANLYSHFLSKVIATHQSILELYIQEATTLATTKRMGRTVFPHSIV